MKVRYRLAAATIHVLEWLINRLDRRCEECGGRVSVLSNGAKICVTDGCPESIYDSSRASAE